MPKRSLRTPLVVLASVGLLAGLAGGTYAAFSNSTSSSGNTFSAAASFGGCPSTNPNPVWMTGVEHGVVSTAGGGLFNYVAGAATADAATKRTGGYSLRTAPTAGLAAYAGPAISGTTAVTRFALRFPSLPSADVAQVAMAYSTTGSVLQLGYRASDQKLTMSWGGADMTVSSTAVAAGTWYVIDMRSNVAASPRTGEWRINGTSQPTSSHVEGATTVATVLFGSINTTDVYTANLDDIAVSTSSVDYPLGDGVIKALSPDGIASHNVPTNFTHENGSAIGATTWNRLDDMPMSSAADSVEQITASGSSYLGFTFADASDTCIRAVSAVLAYHASGNPANNGKTSIFDGSIERTVFSGDMSDMTLSYKAAVIDPDTAPWTKNALNGLITRVGFSTDVTPFPFWDAMLLEYEVAP